MARLPGVYVPSLYRPHYRPDGSFERLEPLADAAPVAIRGRIAADFETRARGIRQLVPNVGIVFDRAQLEVMRGCTRGCRFCQAGMSYRPVRERAPDVAIAAARAILRATGYEEIGLTSLSTADYTYVAEVATAIHRLAPDVEVSLPSTRVDAFTVELIDAVVPTGRRGSFTLAPEAGSQRLRDSINKGVDDEEIARCAEIAFGQGWSALKLYFMIGLPGETLEDVLAIAAICRRALEVGRRFHGQKAAVKASVSTFVPKVGTPFQWAGQDTTSEIEAKVAALRGAMHGRGLELRWNDPRVSILEAALGRGDRRLGAVIERAWRNGARLDAWDEEFRFEAWQAAFAEEGLDPAWYAQRDIPVEEPLPWAHLRRGVSAEFLARDYRRAMDGLTLADCHWGPCPVCGVPEATGFRCRTGEDGPRQLLVAGGGGGQGTEPPEAGDGAGGSSGARSGREPRWRYVGPPGDPRRTAGSSGSGAGGRRPGSATIWPYNLVGSDMQSKNAGLSGLASLVEAAGDESTE